MIKLSRSEGFSLIELVVAVAIMAILASIAFESLFDKFRWSARAAEAFINLSSIQKCQQAYRSENDTYIASPKNPAAWAPATGATPIPWDKGVAQWNSMGFEPDGNVRYQYVVTIGVSAFTAQATGNLDGDADVCVFTISNDAANQPAEAAIYPKPTRLPEGEY